jgi:ABC-2 type transport system ATP-binding protein
MPNQTSPSLQLRALEKSFGAKVALRDVSFSVEPGEIFGFCGRNGAGKTTTMRIVLGVLSADAGTVEFAGRPVTADIRTRFGYMPAERGLYPKMTARSQLTYFARLHGASRSDAAASAHRWAERLEFTQHLDDQVEKLSTGNKQRVQLAIALVADPLALILDEPFSGLDPLAAESVAKVLADIAASGVPVLFSSHQLELVEQLADRVGIIEDGSMHAVGGIDELRAADGEELCIRMSGVTPGWAAHLPDVTVLSEQGETAVVALNGSVDDQHVLRAALRLGSVHEFSRRRRSLAQIYRDAVTP